MPSVRPISALPLPPPPPLPQTNQPTSYLPDPPSFFVQNRNWNKFRYPVIPLAPSSLAACSRLQISQCRLLSVIMAVAQGATIKHGSINLLSHGRGWPPSLPLPRILLLQLTQCGSLMLRLMRPPEHTSHPPPPH